MPPCRSYKTAGTFATGVLAPCGVTSQRGPTFSVTSMRPSGRNAIRHGRLNVATSVIVNGRLASAFCSPALICASADVHASVKSNAVLVSVLVIRSPSVNFGMRKGMRSAAYNASPPDEPPFISTAIARVLLPAAVSQLERQDSHERFDRVDLAVVDLEALPNRELFAAALAHTPVHAQPDDAHPLVDADDARRHLAEA